MCITQALPSGLPFVAPVRPFQPVVEQWDGHTEPSEDWLSKALAPFVTRQCVAAQSSLFAYGDRATCYYFVVSGKLLIRRRAPRARSAIRFMTDGDLFIYDCDGGHVASCDAVVDSTVLRIDRRQFDRQARLDPRLGRVRDAVHTDELEFILRGLGPAPRRRADLCANATPWTCQRRGWPP